MNTKLMISALRQGRDGNQILSILDAVTSDGDYVAPVEVDGFVYMPVMDQYVPNLEEIAF